MSEALEKAKKRFNESDVVKQALSSLSVTEATNIKDQAEFFLTNVVTPIEKVCELLCGLSSDSRKELETRLKSMGGNRA